MPFVTRPNRDRWDRDRTYMRNRAIIRAQRRPCARCGKPIAYDEPYWLPTSTGRRKVNPRAFHCGHIRSRISGGGHELANLQAEQPAVRSGRVPAKPTGDDGSQSESRSGRRSTRRDGG